MKKSFLSFLLGVVVIASTSVFVSCQDYEDEFKDLQEQIDKNHPALNDKVAALQTEIENLEAVVAALQEQHDKDVAALAAADKALQELLSDEIVKANAYALAQAEKALADAKAYADAAAAQAAEQALKDAMAYADKVAAAEAQKEAQAALLAANEQSQKLYLDAIAQLNKAVETINAQIATEKNERQAADAALEKGYKDADAAIEAAYKKADAEIWTALNKAQKDIEAAQAAADKAQATADEALKLAKANEKAIAAEIERATKAEADLKAALDDEAARAKAEEAKIWEAIAEANAKIAANAARIEEVYETLNKKIDAAVDRIKTLENKVSTLQEEMKAAQEKLNDHEARIQALEAWTETYEPIIKDLQTRMAEAETKIADLYKKVAAEEAARIAADEALQKQITANAEAIAQEIKDRAAADEALQEQITANKKAIEKNAEDIKALQKKCDEIWEALEKETKDRKEADADLQNQINTLVEKVDALDKAIKALDEKVEKYYSELKEDIAALNEKLDAVIDNPFQVINEIDFQGAYAPNHYFKYYPAFEVEVAGTEFSLSDRVVEGSYEQTPGEVFVLLCPQGNNFNGHQIYVRDEKNVDYPGYTFGTAKPAVYPEDMYFNFTYGWVTRGELVGEEAAEAEAEAEEETVTGPIWMADITTKQPSNEELLENIPYEREVVYLRAEAKRDDMPTFGVLPRYSVIGEYTQKNAELKDVKMLTWDENFDFWMTPDTYEAELGDELKEDDLDFETPAKEYTVTVDFDGADNELIYKQMVVCDSAYNECNEFDEDAAAYMNGLNEKFGEWVEAGELDDFDVTVTDAYANYTFFYTWYIVGLSGETYTKSDEAKIVPTFDPTVEATFNFEVTPESAALQTTPVQTESVEGKVAADLVWCQYVPECQNVTVVFEPVKAAPEDALFFNLADATEMYPAPVAAETAVWTKAEVDVVKSLGITYDPAKLIVDEPYEYKVTVKYGDEVISETTINIVMRRPEGHDIELIQITSAWNKAKTETIVWAQGYEGATEENLSDAWYKFQGSYTNILEFVDPIDPCGCTLGFDDETDYTNATDFEVVTMPTPGNTFQMDVPSVAVKANTGYKELSFTVLEQSGWWYNLTYGTNVFGLENLYGGEHELAIAYCSPIYYDGVTYNWEKQVYEGGCKLAKENYLIEFPRQETLINEADFVGSNDPSTSIVDPIIYFGPDRDYRILDVKVALGDAEEIKAEYPDYYVWNDPTNEYLFETLPVITDEGIYFKTYNEQPSLQSIPAFYYNLTVIDIWGCEKTYPFVISVNPNTPMN